MNINRLTILGLVIISFSSCATITHRKTVRVNIYTDVDSALVCVKDSDECYVTPAYIELTRSKSDVELLIKKDTVAKTLTLDSQLSSTFIIGNMFFGIGGIAGYLIDLTNPKLYTYPQYNYVSLTGNEKYNKSTTVKPVPISYTRSLPKKNQLYFKVSLPEGNQFYLNQGPEYGYGTALGFLGISVGLEYYFSDLYSINFDIGTMMDFPLPFPAMVDYFGTYERSFANYIDLQIGRDVKFFNFDIGLQFNKTSFNVIESELNYREYNQQDYKEYMNYFHEQFNAGLAFSGHYRVMNIFSVGINYFPSCFTWNKGDFDLHYSHLLMLELALRFKLF